MGNIVFFVIGCMRDGSENPFSKQGEAKDCSAQPDPRFCDH